MNDFDKLKRVATPRKMKWVSVEIFSSSDEMSHHRDGDLTFCPDGTIILGTKAFHRHRPIDDERQGVYIHRARGSNIVQLEFLRGERRYYEYRRILLWWTWYECFPADKPPSLFARLFGRPS